MLGKDVVRRLARIMLALAGAAGLWLLGTWLACAPAPGVSRVAAMPFASPLLTISKTAQGEIVGMPVVYTITVANIPAGDEVTGVVVTDTLPAASHFVSASGGGALDGSAVRWEGLTVPAGGSVQATFTVTTCASSLVNNAYRVVTSTQGVSTALGSLVETALAAPTLQASCSITPQSVHVGSSVAFSDTSTTNGAAIQAWSWDFGDATGESGAAVTHAYAALGSYTVTLTITDACSYSQGVTLAEAVTVVPWRVCLPMWSRPGQVFVPMLIEDALP